MECIEEFESLNALFHKWRDFTQTNAMREMLRNWGFTLSNKTISIKHTFDAHSIRWMAVLGRSQIEFESNVLDIERSKHDQDCSRLKLNFYPFFDGPRFENKKQGY